MCFITTLLHTCTAHSTHLVPCPMQPARHYYRALLKSVDKHITKVSGNTQWWEHVRQEWRQQQPAAADAAGQSRRLELAEDYTFLINNISHHEVGGGVGVRLAACACACACVLAGALRVAGRCLNASLPLPCKLHPSSALSMRFSRLCMCVQDLLKLYNIGIDDDQRNKQMVEKTARRVGFQMPTLKAGLK